MEMSDIFVVLGIYFTDKYLIMEVVVYCFFEIAKGFLIN